MPDPTDPTLAFMLNGKKARFRKEPFTKSKTWTEMSNADDALDDEPYAQLLASQHMFRTVEEAILEAFDWGTVDGICYDDAAAWFAQGATYRDRTLLRRCVNHGLTPAITARGYRHTMQSERITVMQALLRKLTTPARIADQMQGRATR